MHANIQKDGTYSVVPRMWGGLTNPRELRAIADVVEKYNAPMVKVTGGQRLDIFGIKKKDLPAVWADLNAAGMVSGHAYGKALRTVKTCVGRSEEHTSELQSLMRISYAVFCLKNKKPTQRRHENIISHYNQ